MAEAIHKDYPSWLDTEAKVEICTIYAEDLYNRLDGYGYNITEEVFSRLWVHLNHNADHYYDSEELEDQLRDKFEELEERKE